ncbi:MAG: FKBP-type peptidyl-prolyl cis-trans isomerase [Candidatus Kapaibacterium sp.]|jgi:peptidylprolyl isomerase|nr:FKBP-type peptidyl-prolyl cis-trans isomerase [Candidatus Kapabacteria bacterium]
MTKAQIGSNVSVKYTGKLTDGTIFDSTEDNQPFVFTIGNDEVIPGFENGIIGMNVGDTKTLNIPVDEAYGHKSEELIFAVPIEEIESENTLQIGDMLELPLKDGEALYAHIIEISDEEVIIDANHELAGHDLIFDVEILSIN